MSLLSGALLARHRGDYAEARRQFLVMEPKFHDLGDRHRINMVRSELGHLERLEGHYEQAAAIYRDTIREWQRIGHRAAVAHQLECFALLAHIRGKNERAARLFGAAEALREKIGIPMTQPEHVEYQGQVAELRSSMDERAFTSGWTAGRGLTMDQAIRFAVQETGAAAS